MKLTQRETAYAHIRQRMATGLLAPGVRLSPSHLAREIGISHIPVREAISQLKTEGLVVHVAHKGAFVREIKRQELVDLIEMRSIMECHAAAKAAHRISSAQMEELDECWAELCRLAAQFDLPAGTDLKDLLGEWLIADLKFHMTILRAAGNHHLQRMLNETRVMTQMFGYRTDHPGAWANPTAFAAKNLAVHREVYEAIRRNDARGARKAMAAHMKVARRNILARFDWLARQSDRKNSHAEEFSEAMRDLVAGIEHNPDTSSATTKKGKPPTRH